MKSEQMQSEKDGRGQSLPQQKRCQRLIWARKPSGMQQHRDLPPADVYLTALILLINRFSQQSNDFPFLYCA